MSSMRQEWPVGGTQERQRGDTAVELAVFAWEWTRALAGTSWVSEDRTVVADRLTRLTSSLADALTAEPFAPQAGIEIGETLVRIGYAAPDALARTVTLLQQRLRADLGLPAAVDDRLAQLVGTVCLGFTRALRSRTLDEQEAIRVSAVRAWQSAEVALREQAMRNPLTGLPNRSGFAEDLAQLAAKVSRGDADGTVTACLLVITDLPSIDHGVGRDVGDAVLRVLADRLRTRFTGPTELVAHVGRDEFIVAAVDRPEAGDATGPRLVSAQELITAPVTVDGHRYAVSVATGLVARPAERTDAVRLLRDADRAASWARSQGRDSIAIFDRDREARERCERELAADLPDAIEQGRLTAHYQPIVAPATRGVAAMEALARWPHPRHGTVPPAQIIRLAEHGGLTQVLGRSMLRRACEQARSWLTGLESPPLVSVNVFPAQLTDPHTPGTVTEVLEQTDLPPSSLQLEISERTLLSDPRVLRTMADLAALGVLVVVDDFGTGQANIAQLAELPGHGVNGIKLPKDFLARVTPDGTVCHATTSGRAVQVLASTIELAHQLALHVTVEGVETESHHQLVHDLGADLAQGWFYGRPVAADAATERLR